MDFGRGLVHRGSGMEGNGREGILWQLNQAETTGDVWQLEGNWALRKQEDHSSREMRDKLTSNRIAVQIERLKIKM